jgi:hypothetical protein
LTAGSELAFAGLDSCAGKAAAVVAHPAPAASSFKQSLLEVAVDTRNLLMIPAGQSWNLCPAPVRDREAGVTHGFRFGHYLSNVDFVKDESCSF